MVQLKSFRYFEPETAPQEEGAEQLSNRSSGSISVSTGGILTSESSAEESGQVDVSGKRQKVYEGLSTDDSTTLSSSEEYQVANHFIADEEEEQERKSQTVEINPIRVVDNNEIGDVIVQKKQSNEQQSDELTSSRSGHFSQKQQLAGFARTPVGSRWHNQSPSISAVHRQHQLQQSPQLRPASGRQTTPIGANNDNLSQHSSQRFNGQQNSNHFEVRWRNLNLYARRSKVPKLIAENPVYKLFKKPEPDYSNEADKICYSPPITSKGQLFPSSPVATISEEFELGASGAQKVPKSASKPSMDQWMSEQQSSSGPDYRSILNNINGSVFSGQLTAVLGPSGVGKTMLLNSLTGRNTLDGTGRVQLIGGASKRLSVVTVPQADVLPNKLTALEDLQFTSRIKNPQSNFDHKRNVDRIVRHLHMDKFLHTRIDKLSGGEARRLSIGRELLSSPDIMILDEPTSGLDANTCKKIISALRDIVEHSDNILDRPMSIIITIHQPQQEVLNLFHRAYVIALGGRAIYEGTPTNLLPTLFEQSSLSKVCNLEQLNENPAIVALEVASGEYGPNIIAELALHHESQVYYDDSAFETDDISPQWTASPISTPHQLRSPRKSPLSVSPRLDILHKTKMNCMDSPIVSRHTPMMIAVANKRAANQMDRISNVTSVTSYASTYDADLPEPSSRLKVDKRLRRSVVMKTDFVSHTITLIRRCWLLTIRDRFLMFIRVVGFLLVAGGIVQIFAHALDPNEHQCPAYQSEVDDVVTYMDETKKRMLNLRKTIQQFSSTHLFFFHLILCITIVVSALTGLVFPLQMRMFIREYKNGWYSPASFITSNTLAELPVDMIGPIITLAIAYPLSHQPSSMYHWREAGYMIVMILGSIICKSVAQIVGALLMNSVENSVFISCVAVTPSALLSGMAVRIGQMSQPLQLISHGSFIRYVFEGMFVIRYGYGICPCDPEIVNGYPIKTSFDAMPPQLDRLARGFIDLNTPSTSTVSSLSLPEVNATRLSNSTASDSLQTLAGDQSNLFVKFIELVTDASNRFVQDPSAMGDCSKYRSLALLDQGIEDNILPKYLAIMVSMFVISRVITYFVVKLVIRLQDKKR